MNTINDYEITVCLPAIVTEESLGIFIYCFGCWDILPVSLLN